MYIYIDVYIYMYIYIDVYMYIYIYIKKNTHNTHNLFKATNIYLLFESFVNV